MSILAVDVLSKTVEDDKPPLQTDSASFPYVNYIKYFAKCISHKKIIHFAKSIYICFNLVVTSQAQLYFSILSW